MGKVAVSAATAGFVLSSFLSPFELIKVPTPAWCKGIEAISAMLLHGLGSLHAAQWAMLAPLLRGSDRTKDCMRQACSKLQSLCMLVDMQKHGPTKLQACLRLPAD